MDDKTRERFFAKTKLATEIRPGMDTPCLEWIACRTRDGYGSLGVAGKTELAHRVAWEIANGHIPCGLCVLHKCDNPPCVNVDHFFLGTQGDNNADRDAKGRHGAARGDANGTRVHPEALIRGDAHYSRLHPERMARGDSSGSRLHPERLPRGEEHANSKLDEAAIRLIFRLSAQERSQQWIAAKMGVCRAQIGNILARKVWKHVNLEQP